MAQAATEEGLDIEFVTFGEMSLFTSFRTIIESQDAATVDKFRCRPIANLNEISMIVCSSGSTGPCKPTMFSHSALINHMLQDDSFAAEDENVVMWFSSFRWISGTLLPLQSIYFCKTWIICSEYNEELTCKLIERYNVRTKLAFTRAEIHLVDVHVKAMTCR